MYVPHLRLVFGGSLGNQAQEVWANTLHIGAFTNPDAAQRWGNWSRAQADAFLASVQAPIRAFISGTGISQAARLEYIKANPIDTEGKYALKNEKVEYFLPTPLRGGGTAQLWYASMVVTLRTAALRGPGHAGRFYPVTSAAVLNQTDDGWVAASAVQTEADRVATLIKAINAIVIPGAAETDPRAHVITAPNRPNLEQANLTSLRVSGVEMDRVPDTQRRRVNHLERAVVTSSIAP